MGNAQNLGVDLLLDEKGDLMISNNGDLAQTPNGWVCLLQDVAHLLETLPGDLFAHPTYGAGLPRLVGEEDRPGLDAWLHRVVEDALLYEASVAPRIEPDSIEVTRVTGGDTRQQAFSVSFVPLGEAWTNRLNLVWNVSEGDIQR